MWYRLAQGAVETIGMEIVNTKLNKYMIEK